MKNFAKLVGYSFLLYLFFAHFTPFIVQFFPNWQRYVVTANEYGIEPGALYYSDVPVVSGAESATREAVIEAYGSILGWKAVGDKDNKDASKDKNKDKKDVSKDKENNKDKQGKDKDNKDNKGNQDKAEDNNGKENAKAEKIHENIQNENMTE